MGIRVIQLLEDRGWTRGLWEAYYNHGKLSLDDRELLAEDPPMSLTDSDYPNDELVIFFGGLELRRNGKSFVLTDFSRVAPMYNARGEVNVSVYELAKDFARRFEFRWTDDVLLMLGFVEYPEEQPLC